MAILTAKPESVYGIQWMGKEPLIIVTRFGNVTVEHGEWARESLVGEVSGITRYEASEIEQYFTVAPDQQTEAPTSVAKAESNIVGEVESAEYWAVVLNGKIDNDFQGRPAIFFDRTGAECWIARNKISLSDGKHFAIIPIVLPPVAKPDIKGEVWVLVDRKTREAGKLAYTSRERADADIWSRDEREAVQLV